MSKENVLSNQSIVGTYFKVNVYEYPLNWEDSAFGRLKLRLAYKFPNIVKKITSGASMSLDRQSAQEELIRVVSYCRKIPIPVNRGLFGKVEEDKGL